MSILQKTLIWLGSKIKENWRLLVIGFSGFYSGFIFIWYLNFFTTGSFSHYWWIIPLSVITWMVLRFFLRHPQFLYISILYYFSTLIYGLYVRVSATELSDFFFMTSFILVTINITEQFLFSEYIIKLVVSTFFAFLVTYEILPALVPQFNMSYTHLFVMFLLLVLVTASIMVIISELLVFGMQELLGKARKNENA